MNLNDSQQKFCSSDDQNLTLLAPAGCGKTYSLLERCKHLVSLNREDKVLLFTFTRVARNEIRERIRSS